MNGSMLATLIRVLAGVLLCLLLGQTLWSQDESDSGELGGLFSETGSNLEDANDSGPIIEDKNPDEPSSDRGQPEELPPGSAELEDEPLPIEPRIQSDDGESAKNEMAVETIIERYPNGNPKIERQVTQDSDQNYVDHGTWKEFDSEENPIAGGTYVMGKRDGEWFRWYDKSDAELFSKAPFNQFSGPFKSTAVLEMGVLHGLWKISDSENRTICEWRFAHGRRHGVSRWYYNTNNQTGTPMREIHYVNGELHGKFTEWNPNGEAVTEVEYINGRRHEKVSTQYEEGKKKSEGMVLRARYALKKPDEWWTVQLAGYQKEGKDEKHGRWVLWYPNGLKKMEGEYQFDEPSGQFSWWHENGQKRLEAYYSAGKKDAVWTWWHANGQKSIQGTYLNGAPSGRWTWWHESGKVAQRIDYPAPGQAVPVSPNSAQPSHSGPILMQSQK